MLRRLLGFRGPPKGYYSPRFAYARQMGEDAALGLSWDWSETQRMLQGIWRQETGGLTWQEARPVVHHAFRMTREAMAKKDHAGETS